MTPQESKSSSVEPKDTANPKPKDGDKTEDNISPLRCFSGALMSGTLAMLMYRMMSAIAETYANKPIHSTNVTAINIAAAVRTLVVGIVALGAGIFGIAALGLTLLGIQVLVQKLFAAGKAEG
ncbi:MAG: DUF3082 domain-containing protein [Thainema sp.]